MALAHGTFNMSCLLWGMSGSFSSSRHHICLLDASWHFFLDHMEDRISSGETSRLTIDTPKLWLFAHSDILHLKFSCLAGSHGATFVLFSSALRFTIYVCWSNAPIESS
ncbi:hypothetical protein HAX54_025892 [Datura stramonium]|uniref:Uncharacterized protein n=1 Tax=Datura stramonium TaxID=4076 RepID=A0ABS8V2S1_DATST|nr:hypothetical protein [Datura stramonium]